MPSVADFSRFTCSAMGDVTIEEAELDEAIDAPSKASVLVLSDHEVDPAAALGQTATLAFGHEAGDKSRKRTLVVASLELVAFDNGAYHYLVELESAFGLLRLRSDWRNFQDKTTKEIVLAVLDAAGHAAPKWTATGGAAKRAWCVQAGESDFAFVSRLLEEEGISYVIGEDDGGNASLSFVDGTNAFPELGGIPVPLAFENQGMGITDLEIVHSVTSDAVALTDWSFETPGLNLAARNKLADPAASEVFEYPGRYATPAAGTAFAAIRAEEIAAGKQIATGQSSVVPLRSGTVFEITSQAEDTPKGHYLLRRVVHHIRNPYENVFVASPKDLPYRPKRATPRPTVGGALTCTVTGPSGEEIHTDAYGRMKGFFAYDRLSTTQDDTTSNWMRVLQPPMGGSMFLARVGWEMAVMCLDGDPDRPVAVARMYDGTHPPPETLPDAQTKTSFETLNSPGKEKTNAFTIDDKANAMMVEVKAAKDLDATVVHDETETIKANDTIEVGKDSTTLIGDKQVFTVEKDETITAKKDAGVEVAGDRKKTITKDETVSVDGGESVRVNGGDEETVGGTFTYKADDEMLETAKGKLDATVGGAVTSSAGKDYVVYVAGKSSETIGGARSTASSDGTVVIVTGANATYTVGGAVVEVAKGNKLATSQGDAQLTIGAAGSVVAGGKLQIKGKTVKLTIGGAASFIGGGGIVALSPASIAFVGMITLKGSNGVEIKGMPQVVV